MLSRGFGRIGVVSPTVPDGSCGCGSDSEWASGAAEEVERICGAANNFTVAPGLDAGASAKWAGFELHGGPLLCLLGSSGSGSTERGKRCLRGNLSTDRTIRESYPSISAISADGLTFRTRAISIFVKPTDVGRAKISVPVEAPPFPGASKWFLMADLDDPEFLADLIRTTADALPVPKIKTKKSRQAKSKSRSAKTKGRALRS